MRLDAPLRRAEPCVRPKLTVLGDLHGCEDDAMRTLITTSPPIGHIHPVVPLALSLLSVGHDVLWATGADACPIVQSAGLRAVQAGLPARDRRDEYFRRFPEARDLAPEQIPAHMFPRLFGLISAPSMLGDLLRIVEDWQPDIIVHEASELAAPIVAALLDVPNVCQGFGALVAPDRMAAASDAVAPLWREVGLEPRDWAGAYEHMYLDIYPPSLRPPYGEYVTRRESMRPIPFSTTFSTRPDDGEIPHADGRPLVYLTFGTVFNNPAGPFRNAVDGVADLDVRVVVTVGPDGDPAAFGSLPNNVSVHRYVPQTELLPRCSLVVSHAGSGTFLAALDHGLPQLCLPQAADQFGNAQQCASAGAGLRLLPNEVTPESVREAATRLLHDEDFRTGAQRIQRELALMPLPADVVPLLEEIAATGRGRSTSEHGGAFN